MTNTEITYENAHNKAHLIMQDKRSSEEIYNSILEKIRKMYNNKLPEAEIHEAARRLIEFMKIIMEVQMRLEKEKENNKAS
ncbi:hypothetical protein [Rickettsia endosymbiont of Ceutorhynchus obstrictus]|uniref:hypothetical protein n=1 Tax=Rickettsia endosymbiont of Ceutorhynchus obstrictus TaxID=3066249 RepID=UPI003132EFB5